MSGIVNMAKIIVPKLAYAILRTHWKNKDYRGKPGKYHLRRVGGWTTACAIPGNYIEYSARSGLLDEQPIGGLEPEQLCVTCFSGLVRM